MNAGLSGTSRPHGYRTLHVPVGFRPEWFELPDMDLIQKSIFRRIVIRALIIYAGVGFIVIATQILNQVTRIIDARQNVFIVLEFFVFFIPTITVSILPFALLIAIVQTFDTMEEDNEVAVISATGAKPLYTLMPAVVLTIAISVSILLISLFVEPVANRMVRDLINSMKYNAIQIAAGSGALQEVERGLHVRIAEQGLNGSLDRVFILDRRDEVTEQAYYAKSGWLLEIDGLNVLRLTDGTIQYRDRRSGGTSQIVFDNYLVDIESLFSRSADLGYRPRQTGTVDLLTSWRDGNPSNSLQRELVRRFSDWLYPLAFFSIAAFVIVQTGFVRRRVGWRLSISLLAAAILKVLGLVLIGRAGSSNTAALITLILPIGTILLFSMVTLTGYIKGTER